MTHASGCPARYFPDLPCKCGLAPEGEHVTIELRKEDGKGPYRGSLPHRDKLPTPDEFDQNYSIGYSGEFYRACHDRMTAAERVCAAVKEYDYEMETTGGGGFAEVREALADWEKTK